MNHNARARKYLAHRYAQQVKLFPQTAEIPLRSYVSRNLQSVLRNMRDMPHGGERVSEAFTFDD